MHNEPIRFSFLTASKNEERDIRMAIDSMVNQTYRNREIIVVDDSTDGTRDIIREYADKGVKLIEGPARGCCEARNLGMQAATGEVIVFVNADAKLPHDFLARIAKHYEHGAEWVLVKSQAFNMENVYARFMQMQANYEEGGADYSPLTSEGYSVRRGNALAAGMISGNYPLKFCRDYTLGQKLAKAGARKVFDRSIIAPHKAPDHFAEYWDVRKARGIFAAYTPFFMFHKPLGYLAAKFVAKDIMFFAEFALVIPAAYRVFRIARFSPRSMSDYLPFYYAYFIQELSRVVGEWQGVYRLWKFNASHA